MVQIAVKNTLLNIEISKVVKVRYEGGTAPPNKK